jgi:hypothetical protein
MNLLQSHWNSRPVPIFARNNDGNGAEKDGNSGPVPIHLRHNDGNGRWVPILSSRKDGNAGAVPNEGTFVNGNGGPVPTKAGTPKAKFISISFRL